MASYSAYDIPMLDVLTTQRSFHPMAYGPALTFSQQQATDYLDSTTTPAYYSTETSTFFPAHGNAEVFPNQFSPDASITYDQDQHHLLLQTPFMQEAQVYSPGFRSDGLMSPDQAPRIDDWHSQASSSVTHPNTPFQEILPGQVPDVPYYTSSIDSWQDLSLQPNRTPVTPPLSHNGESHTSEYEQITHLNRVVSHEYQSDVDADGEEEEELAQTGGAGSMMPQNSSLQHSPPTPESEHERSSSEDGAMSDDDNDSEYRPGRAAPKSPQAKRSSNASARPARKARKQSRSAAGSVQTLGRGSSRFAAKPKGRSPSARSDNAEDKDHLYYCRLAPFGCTASFPGKNEWKRHGKTKHLQEHFWRCNLCFIKTRVCNDFNRKDLYEQHVQRMHRDVVEVDMTQLSPRTRHQLESRSRDKTIDKLYQLARDRERHDYWLDKAVLRRLEETCRNHLRDLPTSCACPICDHKSFRGPLAWEECMEHMSTHFEKARRASGIGGSEAVRCDPACWRDDTDLSDYLQRENLIRRDDEGRWEIVRETGSRQ